jgi:MFS family permease
MVEAGTSTAGQAMPGGRPTSMPVSTAINLSTLTSGINLDLRGRTEFASPTVKETKSGAPVSQASEPTAQLVGGPAAALAAPLAVAPLAAASGTTATRSNDQSHKLSEIAGITAAAAPLLEAAADKKSAPADLRRGGTELQRLLEVGLNQNSAPADGEDVLAAAPKTTAPKLLASADSAAAKIGRASANEPLPAPTLTPHQKNEFRFYAGSVAAVKVGIEALNLAVPLLLLNTLHAAMAVSTLYLAAEAASVFAGLIGGALVDRVGARRALAINGFVQAAAIIGVPLAIASGGTLALPIVYALFMVNGVAAELFEVARRAALPQIVGHDEGVLRKHNGNVYVWRELAATAGVFATGWLVQHAGAMTAIWMHPVLCLVAGFAALRLLRQGLTPTSTTAPAPSRPNAGLKASLRSWWADIVRGTKYVVAERKLRTIVLVNIPLNALHKIFHTLAAVIYASQVLHNPALAAVMLGAWNLGEMAGAFYLERRGPQSRLSNWMRLAAGASLAVWAWWLFPTIWVAAPTAFILAAAMVGNELGSASYMQSTVPERDLGAVNGFVYAFARAVGIAALLLSGLAWDALGPMGGFLALAALFTLSAPIYLLASRRFKAEKLGHLDGLPDD